MDLPISWTSSISSDIVEAGEHMQPSTAAVELPPTTSLAPLMPSRENHNTTLTSTTFNVYQNFILGMQQFHLGQPVLVLDRSTIPGTQMGHSGSSTDQNPRNRDVLPDISQPMTRMQQFEVNNNNTAYGPQYRPITVLYQGNLSVMIEGQPVLITSIQVSRRAKPSEMLSFNWPRELQIVRDFPYSYNSFRNCIETCHFIVFQAPTENPYLRHLQEDRICAVIELTSETLFLFVATAVSLIGVVCPTDASQLLEQLLRGALERSPNSQQMRISQVLEQGPPDSDTHDAPRPRRGRQRSLPQHMQRYHEQLSLFQQRNRNRSREQQPEIQNRLLSRRLPSLQRPGQEFHNQLQQQHPPFGDLGQQQGVRQELPRRSLQLPQNDGELHNYLQQQQLQLQLQQQSLQGRQQVQQLGQLQQQMQQQVQQQEHVHQEQHPLFRDLGRQQGVRQDLPGRSLQLPQNDGELHNYLQQQQLQLQSQQQSLQGRQQVQQLGQLQQQMQQQFQQQEQVHEEQQIGQAVQPTLITEFGWFRRVLLALLED